MPEDISGYTV